MGWPSKRNKQRCSQYRIWQEHEISHFDQAPKQLSSLAGICQGVNMAVSGRPLDTVMSGFLGGAMIIAPTSVLWTSRVAAHADSSKRPHLHDIQDTLWSRVRPAL